MIACIGSVAVELIGPWI